MQGPSRSALKNLVQGLQELLAGDIDAGASARELFAVADTLDSSSGLRRALTDSTREPEGKANLVGRLFAERVHPGIVNLLQRAAGERWTQERDIADAMNQLGVVASFVAADRRGRAGEVEEQLFRFERIVAGDPALRDAFVDRQRSGEAKGGLVRRLLVGKQVEPEAESLIMRAATHPRGVRFERVLESYLKTAAEVRNQLTAVVTTAVPLDQQQRERMVAALTTMYGRPVVLGAVVDPRVLGGVRVQIGDEMIDGSTMSRLEEVRRGLAS